MAMFELSTYMVCPARHTPRTLLRNDDGPDPQALCQTRNHRGNAVGRRNKIVKKNNELKEPKIVISQKFAMFFLYSFTVVLQ